MSTKMQKLLIAAATVLLVLAAASLVLLMTNPFSKDETGKDSPADTVHEPEEYFYNEDGTLNRIVYYENDEYNGQKDFYSEGKKDYVIYYDKNGENCANELTVKNDAGKTVSYKKSENGKTLVLEEYDYADDSVTLKKYTKKTYDENGAESAEKLYYADDGITVTERVTFLDGEELTRETFDSAHPYEPANTEEN